MTDKDLGAAAGDIFAKAFTLGYETGRKYVPAGGMALTAEQVEDVRRLLDELASERDECDTWDLYDRVRALLPAAEPAKEPREIGWFRTMTPEFATKHFGFPGVIGSKGFWTHTASDGGKWAWDGGDWELRECPPAPAEPAEEETKAHCMCVTPDWYHDGLDSDINGRLCRRCRLRQNVPYRDLASSPVVPASTETEFERGVRAGINEYRLYFLDENNEGAIYQEVPVAELDRAAESAFALAVALDNTKRADALAPTETGPQTLEGPWDRIEDIPKTVGRVTDRDGDVWEWDGDNWVTPETAILPTAYINRKYAPFVAAGEGRA